MLPFPAIILWIKSNPEVNATCRLILTDDENVANSCGEGVAIGVLDVHDVEGARMPLPGHDGANPAGVTPASDHAQVAGVELDRILDLTRGNVHLDRIVHLSKRYD